MVKSFQSCRLIDRESDVHMTSLPLMSGVRVVFSLLAKVCDTDDVRSNKVWYTFYKSIIYWKSSWCMNLVKWSFANIIDVVNTTFPCFLYPNDANRDGLCATVCFSWLNFSTEITLYQTYFSNCFKISAVIISTISPLIFSHIQPTLETKKIFSHLLFSPQPSHPLQTHLLALKSYTVTSNKT